MLGLTEPAAAMDAHQHLCGLATTQLTQPQVAWEHEGVVEEEITDTQCC